MESIINASNEVASAFEGLWNFFSKPAVAWTENEIRIIGGAIVQAIDNYIFKTTTGLLTDIINAAGGDVQSYVSDSLGSIYDAVISTPKYVYYSSNIFANATDKLIRDLTSNVASHIAGIENNILWSMQSIANLDNELSTFATGIKTDVNAAFANLGLNANTIASWIETGVTNAITNVKFPSVNDIANGVTGSLGSVFSDAFKTLQGFWNDVSQGFTFQKTLILGTPNSVINNDITGAPTWLYNMFKGMLKQEQNLLVALAPKNPSDAMLFGTALTDITVVGTLIAEAIGLIADAAAWGDTLMIPTVIDTALEVTGLKAVTAAYYGAIINCALGENLKYFWNDKIQPKFMGEDTAERSLYYGQLSMIDYRRQLKWEGYNPDAIDAKAYTVYKPMPNRTLTRLIDENLIDDSTVLRELAKEGFDPSEIPVLAKALEGHKLISFQDNAKSLVYQWFRDGFLDKGVGTNILNAFSVPANQIGWIFTIANFEFTFQQQMKLTVMIIDEFKKGVLDYKDSLSMLVTLGMNNNRAVVLLKIAALQVAPPLPPSTRAQLLTEAFTDISPSSLFYQAFLKPKVS
jgi:hypothetical protein